MCMYCAYFIIVIPNIRTQYIHKTEKKTFRTTKNYNRKCVSVVQKHTSVFLANLKWNEKMEQTNKKKIRFLFSFYTFTISTIFQSFYVMWCFGFSTEYIRKHIFMFSSIPKYKHFVRCFVVRMRLFWIFFLD